jgi:hypothetical protein
MRRYQRLYEKNAKNNNLPLIHAFLNRKVRVKVSEGLEVEGVLIHYRLQSEGEHRPNVLILKDGGSYHILRGNFESITEADKHEHSV